MPRAGEAVVGAVAGSAYSEETGEGVGEGTRPESSVAGGCDGGWPAGVPAAVVPAVPGSRGGSVPAAALAGDTDASASVSAVFTEGVSAATEGVGGGVPRDRDAPSSGLGGADGVPATGSGNNSDAVAAEDVTASPGLGVKGNPRSGELTEGTLAAVGGGCVSERAGHSTARAAGVASAVSDTPSRTDDAEKDETASPGVGVTATDGVKVGSPCSGEMGTDGTLAAVGDTTAVSGVKKCVRFAVATEGLDCAGGSPDTATHSAAWARGVADGEEVAAMASGNSISGTDAVVVEDVVMASPGVGVKATDGVEVGRSCSGELATGTAGTLAAIGDTAVSAGVWFAAATGGGGCGVSDAAAHPAWARGGAGGVAAADSGTSLSRTAAVGVEDVTASPDGGVKATERVKVGGRTRSGEAPCSEEAVGTGASSEGVAIGSGANDDVAVATAACSRGLGDGVDWAVATGDSDVGPVFAEEGVVDVTS
jgi:hypothetical protein